MLGATAVQLQLMSAAIRVSPVSISFAIVESDRRMRHFGNIGPKLFGLASHNRLESFADEHIPTATLPKLYTAIHNVPRYSTQKPL